MAPHAVLVEDDAGMAAVVGMALRSCGLEVRTVAEGAAAITTVRADPPDLVVLDLMLPDLDGLRVCREIRAHSDVPILMVTARDTTADVVDGLESGADDYLTKPFEAPELIARVRALQRRRPRREDTSLTAGDVVVDPVGHTVHKAGREVALTITEFHLLEELLRHRGQALSRQQLLELVWGYDHLGDSRVVDMAVRRLRRKVEDDPADPRLVSTVRGVGYRVDGR